MPTAVHAAAHSCCCRVRPRITIYISVHKELEALEDFIRKSPTSKLEVQHKFVTFSIHGTHSGARRAASGETQDLHLHQECVFD